MSEPTAAASGPSNSASASGHVIAVIGNPNTGKSTLFNALTGLRQKTGNYPGVTVERHTGSIELDGRTTMLVDLPGAYSLAAHSPDEMIAVDVLLGHIENLPRPKVILVVADATNLRRNLFLVTQLTDLCIPVVMAINMVDLLEDKGIAIDFARLGQNLGVTAVPIVATTGAGLDELRAALSRALTVEAHEKNVMLPAVHEAAHDIWLKLGGESAPLSQYEVERAIIDAQGMAERRFELVAPVDLITELEDARSRLSAGSALPAIEAKQRYDFVNRLLRSVEQRSTPRRTAADRLDEITKHPVIGISLFVLVMVTVFQAVFSWATPMMELIDAATVWLGGLVMTLLPPGAIASLLVDGVIAGVGSVVIFLPQILILFAFIIFLEDSGYMPRVAFMMDRLMRSIGLSGQSFLPMLSSFACAVPGIMATRVIPERRDRLATMLAAPMMTCSARLPVYALLIAAFVPQRAYLGGTVNLQGLVLFGLYLLGILGGIMIALLLKRTALRGPAPTFMIELPPYRWPSARSLLIKILDRGKIFLKRAGTIIFTVAVVIWAMAYFPRSQTVIENYATQRATAEATLSDAQLTATLAQLEKARAAALLEQSALGRLGKAVQPVFQPLGWDWKLSAAVIAGFPAREVVIAVLGTIYAVGDAESDQTTLAKRLKGARHPDGSSVFSLPVVIGLLIFYAFCLQCAATIAVMRRETNGWTWPVFAWVYMTGVGYLGALLAVQLGS